MLPVSDCFLPTISRNSAVFYWKFANLIGSPTLFKQYSVSVEELSADNCPAEI